MLTKARMKYHGFTRVVDIYKDSEKRDTLNQDDLSTMDSLSMIIPSMAGVIFLGVAAVLTQFLATLLNTPESVTLLQNPGVYVAVLTSILSVITMPKLSLGELPVITTIGSILLSAVGSFTGWIFYLSSL